MADLVTKYTSSISADEYHLCRVEAVDYQIPPDQMKLRVWEKQHPEGVYVIGVDPAGGRSEDSNYHAISCWRAFADKLVQVAEWADPMPETRHCAWVAAYLAGQYQNQPHQHRLDRRHRHRRSCKRIDDLRSRMRSEEYQNMIRKAAEAGDGGSEC